MLRLTYLHPNMFMEQPLVGHQAATSATPETMHQTRKDMVMKEVRMKAGPPRARVWPLPTKSPVPLGREGMSLAFVSLLLFLLLFLSLLLPLLLSLPPLLLSPPPFLLCYFLSFSSPFSKKSKTKKYQLTSSHPKQSFAHVDSSNLSASIQIGHR